MIVIELEEGASVEFLNLDATVYKEGGVLLVKHKGAVSTLRASVLGNGNMLVDSEAVLLVCLLHPVVQHVLVTGQLKITPDEVAPDAKQPGVGDGEFEVKTETPILLGLT